MIVMMIQIWGLNKMLIKDLQPVQPYNKFFYEKAKDTKDAGFIRL
jgi:hypothetical protein